MDPGSNRHQFSRIRDAHVHQYLEPWLSTFYGGTHSPSALNLDCAADATSRVPVATKDEALANICQFAALRLGFGRALVSLIDSSAQYVLAEGFCPPPLSSSEGTLQDQTTQSLWFGHGTITRDSGICGEALNALILSGIEPPFISVPDLCADPRFNRHAYIHEQGAHFFASVPIHSSQGNAIGTLSIVDDQVRTDAGPHQAVFLSNLSKTITRHLEGLKSQLAQSRGERMMKSFSLLRGGQGSLRAWWISEHSGASKFYGHSVDNPDNAEDTANEMFGPEQHLYAEPPSPSGRVSSGRSSPSSISSGRSRRNLARESEREAFDLATSLSSVTLDQRGLFDRASNLIRESMSLDGAIFFDASSNDWVLNKSPDGDKLDPSTGENKSPNETNRVCPVIGFSFAAKSSLMNYTPSAHHQVLPQAYLQKLLTLYPHGKIFNFTGAGELSSSSESERNGSPGKNQLHNELAVLRRLAPNARSIAFLPLWDWNKNRWFSACFTYTTNPVRVLTYDTDMTFLSAFCVNVMHSLSMMNAAESMKSKDLFLSTISHEMRSPLHGILAGTDFLKEMHLDGFGESMLATVETSGKALLDTVNHLLDFANISTGSASGAKMKPKTIDEIQEYDLALVLEEVVNSVCLGSFGTTKDEMLHRSFASSDGPDDIDTTHTKLPTRSEEIMPYIIINVDWTKPWTISSVPKTVARRVIMNLVRNALKFTPDGYIIISLRPGKASRPATTPEAVPIVLEVEDSGCGMSEEFLRHHVFTPFIKENSLSPGIGLGLHLTRNLVTEMGGRIEFQSQVGVGTTARITFPPQDLPDGPPLLRSVSVPDSIRGISVDALGFNQTSSRGGTALKRSLESILTGAIGIKIRFLDNFAEAVSGDILLIRDEEFERSVGPVILEDAQKPLVAPMIVLCQSIAYAYRASKVYPHLDFVTPPLGPMSIGRVLSRYRDLEAQPRSPTSPLSPSSQETSPTTPCAPTTPDINSQPASGPAAVEKKPKSKTKNAFPFPPTMRKPPTRSPSPKERPLFGLKLLLVEDNAINLQLLVAFARKNRIDHASAMNGKEALDLFIAALDGAAPFQAVLTDVSMPVMDGLELTRQVRAAEREYAVKGGGGDGQQHGSKSEDQIKSKGEEQNNDKSNPKHLQVQTSTEQDKSQEQSGRRKGKQCQIIALTGVSSELARKEAASAGVDVFLSKPAPFKRIYELLVGDKSGS